MNRTAYRYARRLHSLWLRATPAERKAGRSWYSTQRRLLIRPTATALGLTLEQFAAVVAAISPGCSWDLNVLHAILLVRAWRAGEPIRGISTYSTANVNKAVRVLEGERPEDVLGGPKVTAFYRLLRDGGNWRDVCVDGHILGAATGQGDGIRSLHYGRPVKRDVRLALLALAGVLRVRPCTLQATVWLTWKRMKGAR